MKVFLAGAESREYQQAILHTRTPSLQTFYRPTSFTNLLTAQQQHKDSLLQQHLLDHQYHLDFGEHRYEHRHKPKCRQGFDVLHYEHHHKPMCH